LLADDGSHGFDLLHKPYSVEELSKLLRRAMADRRLANWDQRSDSENRL
jgi:hypothetical protein